MAGPVQKSNLNKVLDEITESIELASKNSRTSLDKLLPVKTEFKVKEGAAVATLKLSETLEKASATKDGYKKLTW